MKTIENLVIAACVLVLLMIGSSMLKPAAHAATNGKTAYNSLVNSLGK